MRSIFEELFEGASEMLAYAGHLPVGRLRPKGNEMNELIVITYFFWTLALIISSILLTFNLLKNSPIHMKEYSK